MIIDLSPGSQQYDGFPVFRLTPESVSATAGFAFNNPIVWVNLSLWFRRDRLSTPDAGQGQIEQVSGMKNRRMGIWLLAGVLVVLLAAGCGTTPPTRFYQLTPQAQLPPDADRQPVLSGLAIGVGPVRLADYLGRSQIVLRESMNKLQLVEFDRWGGPLEANIALVLAENLSRLLGTDSVITFPWQRAIVPEYQVAISVRQLDSTDGNQVDLIALWQILDDEGRSVLSINRTEISEPMADPGIEALVAAQSRALGRMSEEIAAVIRKHHTAGN